MDATVLIMAAGSGTRMCSEMPKVHHPLCGRPLVLWPVEAAREAGATGVVVICGPGQGTEKLLPSGVVAVEQPVPLGTGDAVKRAAEHIPSEGDVVVLSGDHPLVTAVLIDVLVGVHLSEGATATFATADLEDPSGYGRVVRAPDGEFERIVETKNPAGASEEELALQEVNTGTYCFKGASLLAELERLGTDNSQSEAFLGDVLPALISAGEKVVPVMFERGDFALGVNTRADLAKVREVAQGWILEEHMLAGVTITDPASTLIDVNVQVGSDTTIEPYCNLRGRTVVGSGAVVGPLTTMESCVIGDGSRVVHSYLERCEVAGDCQVGPYAYIRPDTKLNEGVKAGTFVEIKNSQIGAGSKVPHLSYVGDAEVGEQTNIGAGNITANYDGREKHRTRIGNRVKTGVDTSFVAPVSVGDGAYTGAGSVITEDVPDGSLGITRAEQTNVEGYAERKEKKGKKES